MRSSADPLTTTTSQEGATVTLTCSGAAETTAFGQLRTVLADVHDDVLRTSSRNVIVDVRELEFASSSCLKEFVTWLMRVVELEDSQRYQIRFRSNSHHSWQRRSLGAIAVFAGSVVQIDMDVS